MTELRRKARRSGVYLRVLKNTLARRAVKDTPFSKLADSMIGPLVYGISSDPVATRQGDERVREGQREVRDPRRLRCRTPSSPPRRLRRSRSLPSREELLSKLMGTMQAPIAQFVRTLNEVPSRFVRTLAAVHAAKEKASA